MNKRFVLVLCLGLFACDGCEDPVAKNNDQNNINRPDANADLPIDLDMAQDMKGDMNQMGELSTDQPKDQASDQSGDQTGDQGADMPGDQSSDQSADLATDQPTDIMTMPDHGNDMNVDMSSDATMTDMRGDMTPDMMPDMMAQSPCLSGGNGKYVARFKWLGNGPSSRAYVRYESNTLPDTSRWKAGANARNVGYQPVFQDTFLGEGGLQMSGTVFMDVELSTQGASYTKATLAIFGRSYNTTSSGSFRWQTFSGVGNSPYGGVANSAPYQWYTADATAALPTGNASTLLRIYPDGPSNALIVRQVEICFE